ncbi:hypothetical protein M9Y10_030717 [Tritrichomonas musculus]|uniref:Uncharacterized protein n=1 Tax=Tritrichomonas musculus TaxID=1915356 RepID=A0ABR2H2Q7_9EUKA
MAIDRGNKIPLYNYAGMSEKGEGTTVDMEEALNYYKIAIEKYLKAEREFLQIRKKQSSIIKWKLIVAIQMQCLFMV